MKNKERVIELATLIYFVLLCVCLLLMIIFPIFNLPVIYIIISFLLVLLIGYLLIGIMKMNIYRYHHSKCGNVQKLTFFNMLFAKRGDNTRKLKCSKCQEVDYLERIVK